MICREDPVVRFLHVHLRATLRQLGRRGCCVLIHSDRPNQNLRLLTRRAHPGSLWYSNGSIDPLKPGRADVLWQSNRRTRYFSL